MLRQPLTLWAGFLLIHSVLGILCLTLRTIPMGDVTIVYAKWVENALAGGSIVGITTPWVYPVLALVPILLPAVAGMGAYAVSWLVMVTLLNAVAFLVLIRRAPLLGWYWIAFLALLGPVALGRIDTVSVALAVIAVVVLERRMPVATLLFVAATWIKVWPAAAIASLLVVRRDRVRVLFLALVGSAAIAVLSLALGGGAQLFSFLGEQDGRGMQIEAPLSAPWMWAAVMHVGDARPFYDHQILTFEVSGVGTHLMAALATPLLVLATLVVALLGVRAVRAGADRTRLFPVLLLALVASLIVFNKVGSPQFHGWLLVPILAGLLVDSGYWRRPAALVLVLVGLTQLIYPHFYAWLLMANPFWVGVLTVRNLLDVVLFGWAVNALWKSGRKTRE